MQTGSSRGPAGISTLFQAESPLLVGIPPHRPPAQAPLSFPRYLDWSGELTPSTPSWETKTQKEGSAVSGLRTHEKQVPRPPASWASGLPTLLWVLLGSYSKCYRASNEQGCWGQRCLFASSSLPSPEVRDGQEAPGGHGALLPWRHPCQLAGR